MEVLQHHFLNCNTDPLIGFRLHHDTDSDKINYKYNCYDHFERRTAAWGYNTGMQEMGGVVYMDRQHAWCPDGSMMNALGGQVVGDSFTYNFICSQYKVDNVNCKTYSTPWAPTGDSGSMSSLSSHYVMCPDDSGLVGFEGEVKSCGWWCTLLKFNYKCCTATVISPTVHPTRRPNAEPSLHPTREPTLSPFVPKPPKGFSQKDVDEFVNEIIIDKAPIIPDADTPVEVVQVLDPVDFSGVDIPNSKAKNPISPSVKEIIEEVKEEAKEVPISEPTMAPTMKKALMCPIKIKKGDSDYVPAGCALFSRNDIGWSDFSGSQALYVCTTVDVVPTKMTTAVFKTQGLMDTISVAKPGEGVTITLFSGSLSGHSHAVSTNNYKPLTHFKFEGGSGDLMNDSVKSSIVTSTTESTFLHCDDLKTAIRRAKFNKE
jgi:hypothetical protein